MADETTPEVVVPKMEQLLVRDPPEGTIVKVDGIPLPPQHTRRQIVVATILFSWACIVSMIVLGDPANSLHVSALGWAFTTMLGVIFAYVFGAVTDNYNIWKKIIS